MSRLSKSRQFISIIFPVVFSALVLLETRGAGAYLESGGPPPLRFETVNTNDFLLALRSLPPVKPAELVSTQATLTNAAGVVSISNSIPNFAAALPVNANTNHVSALSETPGNLGNNSAKSPSSASDVLTVTPQMITEYLKPVQNGTSPGGQGASAPVEFLPPPQAPAGSQAIYKSQ